MAIEKITDGMTGAEAADRIYNNDIENANAMVRKDQFSAAIDAELDKDTPIPFTQVFGKDAPGISGNDNVLNVYRWTYPDAVVDKDGTITQVKFTLGVAGQIIFAIGTPNYTAGTFTPRINIVNHTGVVGLNTVTLNQPIFAGEAVVIAPAAGSTARINYSTGSDPLTGTSKYIQQTTTAITGQNTGFYAYSFTVTGEAGESRLYDVFAKKDDTVLKIEFSEAIDNELDKPRIPFTQEFGKPGQMGNQAGGDNVASIYRWTFPNVIVDKKGHVTQIKFYLPVAGPIKFGIALLTQGKALTYLRDIASRTGVAGWNTISIDREEIKPGEGVVIGPGSDTTTRIGYSTGSDPAAAGSTLIQSNLQGGVFGQFVGFYAYSFTVVGETGESRLYNEFVPQENLNEVLNDYLETPQVSKIPVTLGTGNVANSYLAAATNRYLTPIGASPFNALIQQIRIRTNAAGNVVFSIGLIDQNNRWIEERTISRNLVSGLNTIVVNEPIKKGQQLAIRTNVAPIGVQTGSGNYLASTAGGNLLSAASGMLALDYDLFETSEYAVVGRNEFKALSNQVAELSTPKQTVILSTPGRLKYEITCDDDGSNLRAVSLYPNATLVLGNSITSHGITSYWWGVWGMAASVRNKDFVHLLEAKIQTAKPGATVTPLNISTWEQNHTTYDLNQLNSSLTGKDYVIIRLGENVPSNTVASLQASTEALIDHIRAQIPNARIAITGNFWAAPSKDAAFVAAANNKNIPYIPLAQLDTTENRSAMGAQVYGDDSQWHTVDNTGVAAHPGDLGMQRIADTIYAALFN